MRKTKLIEFANSRDKSRELLMVREELIRNLEEFVRRRRIQIQKHSDDLEVERLEILRRTREVKKVKKSDKFLGIRENKSYDRILRTIFHMFGPIKIPSKTLRERKRTTHARIASKENGKLSCQTR